MQLLNHHQRPRETFSFGFIIIILVSFLVENTFAEYDCSAKDDGWYYDPEFCHIYWRCIHGSSEEFECASGTAWDHHENRCNWIDNVDCSRAEKTTPKAQMDYADDVDITDDNNGHHHNDDDDDEPPVVAPRKTTKRTKKKPAKAKTKQLTADDEDNDEKPLVLIIYTTNASSDFLCAGRDGFFADPDYCTRYYRCSHGNDEVFECPRGTAWDDVTKSCAWVDQVNCEGKTLGYSTSTPSEETTSGRRKSDTESVQSESNPISTNAKDGNGNSPLIECQPTGIYVIPDPVECNSYYQCDKGTRTKLNCPERQLFDIEKRQCNEYERVACGTRTANLADKNQCVNKRDGIYADTERDCHYYYQCAAHNKLREAKCPGDQKFNINTLKCGPPQSAPVPCGSFIPGSSTSTYLSSAQIFAYLFSTIMMFVFVNIH